MPKVNITFAVQSSGSKSNRVSTTQELSTELYESLHQSVYRGTGDAERWIQNNLFGLVSQQLGVSGNWHVVDPMITKV